MIGVWKGRPRPGQLILSPSLGSLLCPSVVLLRDHHSSTDTHTILTMSPSNDYDLLLDEELGGCSSAPIDEVITTTQPQQQSPSSTTTAAADRSTWCYKLPSAFLALGAALGTFFCYMQSFLVALEDSLPAETQYAVVCTVLSLAWSCINAAIGYTVFTRVWTKMQIAASDNYKSSELFCSRDCTLSLQALFVVGIFNGFLWTLCLLQSQDDSAVTASVVLSALSLVFAASRMFAFRRASLSQEL